MIGREPIPSGSGCVTVTRRAGVRATRIGAPGPAWCRAADSRRRAGNAPSGRARRRALRGCRRREDFEGQGTYGPLAPCFLLMFSGSGSPAIESNGAAQAGMAAPCDPQRSRPGWWSAVRRSSSSAPQFLPACRSPGRHRAGRSAGANARRRCHRAGRPWRWGARRKAGGKGRHDGCPVLPGNRLEPRRQRPGNVRIRANGPVD